MFLNPLLLYGAFGISIPIIIHLLNQRKFQRVRWAAMRFIAASLEKNRRRMQLEDLLLLLLRCLIVAMLAIALARPALKSAGAILGRPPVTAVILLDNSYSMSKTDGTQTRFDKAKKAADEVIANLPTGSSASLFLFSDAVRDVIPNPTSDLPLAREKIRQATLSDRATNILTGLQRARQSLASAQGNREIYLITDGQALGWHNGSATASTAPASGGESGQVFRMLKDMKDTAPAHVLLVGDDDTRNLSVTAVRLTTELPTINKVLRFDVQVNNWGNAEARDLPVRLFVDDNGAPVEEAVIDAISARGSKSISLHARLRSEGFHAVTARIAPDALTTDDARSTIVHALRQVQVLLVNGEAGREGREEDVFFLREALQPVSVDLRPSYFIQTRTINASDFAQTSLDSYDAVALANVATLPRAAVATLEKFVADGHGLIVFPGPNASTSFYNELYRSHGLLPAGFGEAVGDSNQGERFETLQTTRFDHPIMTLWNEEGRGNPGVAHFFRMMELRLDPTATTAASSQIAIAVGKPAVVASYANGKPAIIEHTFGEGRVILFGSTANTQWNDLPVRASIFIPIMHRVLDSILEHQDERLSIQVGQTFSWRTSSQALGKDAQITAMKIPGGAAAPANDLPLTDSVHVDLQGNIPEIIYDRTELGGIYKATIDGTTEDPVLFAVQPDTQESDLMPLSPMEIAQINTVAPVVSWKPGTAFQPAATVIDVGREIWWPIAVTLLAVAAVETFLAFWFSRVK